MNVTLILGLICLMITGLFLGYLIGQTAAQKELPTIGTLRIDTSGAEKDIYSLEIDKVPLEDLPKYNKVELKIESSNSPK